MTSVQFSQVELGEHDTRRIPRFGGRVLALRVIHSGLLKRFRATGAWDAR